VSEVIAPAVGQDHSRSVVTEVGDRADFPTHARTKAYGLELEGKSSGKYKGDADHKWGSGELGSTCGSQCSLAKKDAIVQAWYAAKVKRDGGSKAVLWWP